MGSGLFQMEDKETLQQFQSRLQVTENMQRFFCMLPLGGGQGPQMQLCSSLFKPLTVLHL